MVITKTDVGMVITKTDNHLHTSVYRKKKQQNLWRGLVILSYAKGFSEKVARVLRSFSIKVAHKPIRTISNILKKPKLRQNQERG